MSNYSFKSPIITIFGGTGFLGRYIVNRLAKLGYIINVVTRFPNEAIFLKTSGNVGQINFVKGSFSNLSKLSYLLSSSEIVINCVGILNEEKNKKFRQIHSDAPEKLAILAKDKGVKNLFIFLQLERIKNQIAIMQNLKVLEKPKYLMHFQMQ